MYEDTDSFKINDAYRKICKQRLNSLCGKCVSERSNIFNKLIIRIKACWHICLWCKYKKICDLSWWSK